jgi:hypothetical protein
LFLAPLLLLALWAHWTGGRAFTPRPAAPAPVASDPERTLDGWFASLEGADGSVLELRLGPLYAQPERQAFDAQALRAKLGLSSGQPMRLQVQWRPRAKALDSLGRAPLAGGATFDPAASPELAEGPAALGLGPLWVTDEDGHALSTLEFPADEATPVRDPLRTLLQAPGGALAQGQSAEWVLWGRIPGPRARVAGLLPDPQADPEAAFQMARDTGLLGALELVPQAFKTREWSLPLAHGQRKNDALRASDGAVSTDSKP